MLKLDTTNKVVSSECLSYRMPFVCGLKLNLKQEERNLRNVKQGKNLAQTLRHTNIISLEV